MFEFYYKNLVFVSLESFSNHCVHSGKGTDYKNSSTNYMIITVYIILYIFTTNVPPYQYSFQSDTKHTFQ